MDGGAGCKATSMPQVEIDFSWGRRPAALQVVYLWHPECFNQPADLIM
jgi:hypothetical protein